MQLTQELTFHAVNMRDAFGKLKAYRPRKWAVFAFVVIAFVTGWWSGWSRGINDHTEIQTTFDGAMLSIAAKERADGKPFLTERFYRRAVDRMVQQRVEQLNASTLEKLKKVSSPMYWSDRRSFDLLWGKKDHKHVVTFAEQRLTLATAPTEQTKRTLAELNRSWLVESTASNYVDTAAAYSSLLGRQIRPEALVTNVEIQEQISRITNRN